MPFGFPSESAFGFAGILNRPITNADRVPFRPKSARNALPDVA